MSPDEPSSPPPPTVASPSFFQRLWDVNEKWLELLAVVLLSVASLTAAWSGYQASRWGGLQSELYSSASAMRTESTRASNSGYLYVMNDIEMFNRWAESYARGDTDLQTFYRNRFSPELETAVVAWLATNPLESADAPTGPLRMPEYQTPLLDAANQLEVRATATFAIGRSAGEQGSEYVQTTVFLALVLFFAGISSRVSWKPGRIGVLALATCILVFSFVRISSYPLRLPDAVTEISPITIDFPATPRP